MGILESLCTFQLLSIKRLDALSKSQGAMKLTIAPAALFKVVYYSFSETQ